MTKIVLIKRTLRAVDDFDNNHIDRQMVNSYKLGREHYNKVIRAHCTKSNRFKWNGDEVDIDQTISVL